MGKVTIGEHGVVAYKHPCLEVSVRLVGERNYRTLCSVEHTRRDPDLFLATTSKKLATQLAELIDSDDTIEQGRVTVRQVMYSHLEHISSADKKCSECAYNSNDDILRANCVGCYGITTRPHFVHMDTKNPSTRWGEAQAAQLGQSGK